MSPATRRPRSAASRAIASSLVITVPTSRGSTRPTIQRPMSEPSNRSNWGRGLLLAGPPWAVRRRALAPIPAGQWRRPTGRVRGRVPAIPHQDHDPGIGRAEQEIRECRTALRDDEFRGGEEADLVLECEQLGQDGLDPEIGQDRGKVDSVGKTPVGAGAVNAADVDAAMTRAIEAKVGRGETAPQEANGQR